MAPQRTQHAKHSRTRQQRSSARSSVARPAPFRIPLALLVAVIVGLAAGLFAARACTSDAPTSPDAAEPAYPLENFSLEDDRYTYRPQISQPATSTANNTAAQTAEPVSRTGIDVSENQVYIDWDAVAADGVDFAFIRLGYRGTTEGKLYEDGYYAYNIEEAQAAGIDCGVYFFSQAITEKEAVEEAQFVLKTLGKTKITLPIVFDSETNAAGVNSRTSKLTSDEITNITLAFCNEIQKAGWPIMVYGNQHDLARLDLDKLSRYRIWYAEYGELPNTSIPFAIWQYSRQGSVAGVDGNVDMNLMMDAASF